MKGIIFNQLENMVTDTLGLEAWDALLSQTELKTANGLFIGPNTYPDSDLFALVDTASRITGTPAPDLVRAFGRYLFPKLASGYPMFLREGMTAKSFLLSVDRVIHVEVRKLDASTGLPTILYEDPAPDQLVLLYRSPRGMCAFAEGLIDGVAAHFGETIVTHQSECIHHGAPQCRIECTFGSKG